MVSAAASFGGRCRRKHPPRRWSTERISPGGCPASGRRPARRLRTQQASVSNVHQLLLLSPQAREHAGCLSVWQLWIAQMLTAATLRVHLIRCPARSVGSAAPCDQALSAQRPPQVRCSCIHVGQFGIAHHGQHDFPRTRICLIQGHILCMMGMM